MVPTICFRWKILGGNNVRANPAPEASATGVPPDKARSGGVSEVSIGLE